MAIVRRAVALCAVALAATSVACNEPSPPRLLALPGCGLDEDLTTLRVRVRGDFPLDDTTEVVIADGDGEIPRLPPVARGITVEGEVGEFTAAVGRTARLSRAGDLPVYFAPPDSMCPVPTGLGPRELGAIGVGAEGDVLLVGGREADGRLSNTIVLFRDSQDGATLLGGTLPIPSTGQTVHGIGDRRFVVVGGAGPSAPVRSMVVVNADAGAGEDPVGDPVLISVDGEKQGRAHHAAAALPDGRILVVGGCLDVTDGRCSEDAAALGSTMVVDPRLLVAEAGPPLTVARHGAQLHAAEDGVAIVIGGRNGVGDGVRDIERLVDGAWTLLPIDLSPWLDDARGNPTAVIVGSALLSGGVVVVALDDGRLLWVGERAAGELRDVLPPADDRRLLATIGERVLADAFIVPGAAVGEVEAVDLSQEFTAPDQRVGAAVARLADGTLLLAGGRDPDTGALETPLLARVRPALDGPDETVPNVAGLAPGSFIGHDLDRVSLDVDGLHLDASGAAATTVPWVRAHVRGFRSARFRLDAEVVVSGDAHASFVLERGARELTAVGVFSDHVEVLHRDHRGDIAQLDCEAGRAPGAQTDLRLEVDGELLTVSAGGDVTATCLRPSAWPVAIGLGASGDGEVRATQLRLTRQ